MVGGVAMVGAFVGVRAALALSPGVRDGRARTALSVAGTINGGAITGSTVMVDYVFVKSGTVACRVPTMLNRNAANGHFTGEVDIERCPANLFDGSDVTTRVEVGGVSIAAGAVNPVPYAQYAERVGVPDCPNGYERDATATGIVLCRRGIAGGSFDEVVRVGTGASAFWVDRYEASVWSNADGGGTQLLRDSGDTVPGFSNNGQRVAGPAPVYAISRAGVRPSGYPSWFQALEACAATGKRLLDREEWFRAANGTPDPTTPNDGLAAGNTGCNTQSAGQRFTGLGAGCVSIWGAQDMIGNVSEWTDEWHASPDNRLGATTDPAPTLVAATFGSDSIVGVTSSAFDGDALPNVSRLRPAAMLRGGHWRSGTDAGVFALNLAFAPGAGGSPTMGFRCMIPR